MPAGKRAPAPWMVSFEPSLVPRFRQSMPESRSWVRRTRNMTKDYSGALFNNSTATDMDTGGNAGPNWLNTATSAASWP